METSSRHRILIVDDEADNLRALERTLRGYYEVTSCETPAQALEQAKQSIFSVIISDQRMPGMAGTELLAQMAIHHPLTTRIILTAFTESKDLLDAINRAEIYRYVTKPWDNTELLLTVRQATEYHALRAHNEKLLLDLGVKTQHLTQKEQELLALNQRLEKLVESRTAELRAANERLNELAMTDPLTKIHNRRAFFARFTEELERSKRYKHAISVAMIDVDHFKSFNDMEGHICGDEALRKIAQTFIANLRKTDMLCRYGGEEFVLMMPETPIDVGMEICRRLRASIEAAAFQGQTENAYLTVSIGVAGYPQNGMTAEALVHAADQALYLAKDYGRNRVEGAP